MRYRYVNIGDISTIFSIYWPTSSQHIIIIIIIVVVVIVIIIYFSIIADMRVRAKWNSCITDVLQKVCCQHLYLTYLEAGSQGVCIVVEYLDDKLLNACVDDVCIGVPSKLASIGDRKSGPGSNQTSEYCKSSCICIYTVQTFLCLTIKMLTSVKQMRM